MIINNVKVNLPAATIGRLKRIQEVKQFDLTQALIYATTCGWLSVEKEADREDRVSRGINPTEYSSSRPEL